jgi:RND superfamily putative drug exporter
MREIAPIVAVAGTTVAVGTIALVVARLEFLRAFGPGLAVAVLMGMIVALTFVPSVLAIGGERLFWPRKLLPAATPSGADPKPEPRRRRRLTPTGLAARHPIPALLLAVAIVVGAASGLLWIALGNEVIVGLPHGSGVERGYAQARDGFAPGVLAPALRPPLRRQHRAVR